MEYNHSPFQNPEEVHSAEETARPQPDQVVYTQTESSAPAPQKRSKRWIAFLIIGCLLTVAVLGAGGIALGRQIAKPTESSSSTENPPKIQTENKTPVLSSESLSMTQVAAKCMPSVVAITTETLSTSYFLPQLVSTGAGSGVIITEDGYILTNNHVIDGAAQISVKLSDGATYTASLVAADEQTDLALIKVDATGLTPATFGDSSALAVGQKVFAIGNPLGTLGNTVTDGIVSALDREITISGQSYTLLQTSAAINPGNSGGGLFDEGGNLIGIVNARANYTSSGDTVIGIGFAIPSNTASSVANELLDHGYVGGRVKLGVTLINISDTRTAMMYRVSKTGIYILQIESDSNASKAGLQVGDRLIRIGDTEITATEDVEKVLQDTSVGDTLKITVERDNSEKTFEIMMAESSH